MTAQNPPGLRPLAGKDPTILVLGSFPSIISLEKGEYYANPRNSFWRIMDVLFGVDSNLPYERRVEILLERGIVLWDVISVCSREGSSDSSIRDAVPNDITGFIRQNPTIKCIVLNGAAGAGMWFKRICGELPDYPGIAVLTLLSTSPANASYSFDEKVSRWRSIVEFAKN
ncbi:MAG: DNA-deoxyinosine glycosylase [Methanomicrobiaceae archaeon]|nr:DNA-deoxyinosine glycosylase [Methanomicrobiaceae archaeon]